MPGAKYSDLEKGETTQLTDEQKKSEDPKIQICWWCMLLCPIVVAVCIIVFFILVIIDQYDQKEEMEHKEDFNNIWIILSFIGVVFCSCPLICQSVQLMIGYMCYPGEKKVVEKAGV